MKTLAFFNNKGGVGKTTLAAHVAWMFQHMGARVLLLDLDPQANLTAAMVSEARLEELWDTSPALTIAGALQPLLDRLGDLGPVHVESIAENLWLIPGDLTLARFEDRLAETWPRCLDDNAANVADAFRVTTAFYRAARAAADARGADIVLLDVGPSLGALNRAALVAADLVVVPLAADLFSLRGLENLGPTLREWREGWNVRRSRPHVPSNLVLPSGTMTPIGYVVLQHAAKKASEPARAYRRWIDRFPRTFHERVLCDAVPEGDDPARLALLRHYRSLLPMSLEARKPVFDLTAADGAIGSHAGTVQDANAAFRALVETLASHAGVVLPTSS